MPMGQHRTAFDREIEAIRTTLRVLNCHHNKFERAVIFFDSKAAILSVASALGLYIYPECFLLFFFCFVFGFKVFFFLRFLLLLVA